jgi:predicted dehydrogenase
MKVLILGYSNIVARLALPALLQTRGVDRVEIASRRRLEGSDLPADFTGDLHVGYAEALEASDADLVYVSLVNSLHERWVEAALRSGRHVIVDKPAFLSFNSARRLDEMARTSGLCLAEAVVFADHPQVGVIRRIVEESQGITRLLAAFSFPPLAEENFRNHPELGGGSLYDLGTYAAAAYRLFFESPPQEITCRVLRDHPATGVDTAFSVLAVDQGGHAMLGSFGFDTQYQNWVTAIGPDLALSVERIFTIPPDLENRITVSRRGERSTITAPAGSSFGLYFERLVRAIQEGDWEADREALLGNAAFLERMRTSIGERGGGSVRSAIPEAGSRRSPR